jgi:hypothetical protein
MRDKALKLACDKWCEERAEGDPEVEALALRAWELNDVCWTDTWWPRRKMGYAAPIVSVGRFSQVRTYSRGVLNRSLDISRMRATVG